MRFLGRRLRIVIIVVIGFILALGGYYLFNEARNSPGQATKNKGPATSMTPTGTQTATPSDARVSFEIKNSNAGQDFVVAWKNLGSSTQALDVYKSRTGTGSWSLWRSVPVPNGSQTTGVAETGTGHESLSGNSFYVQAVSFGDGGSGGSSGGGEGDAQQNILWTSPPAAPSGDGGTDGQNQNQSSSSDTSADTNTPVSGPRIPSFQISNSDTWIEITWQNLPTSTTSLVISRAGSPDGPWTTFFTEPNPVTDVPYTVKVVIDTPNMPFYYELTAYNESALIGTYGPIYLSAIHQ
jgi:hypothetical protein